ncbi:MAG: tetratricopeptide repeat protein [Pseudomonadota bacterium]
MLFSNELSLFSKDRIVKSSAGGVALSVLLVLGACTTSVQNQDDRTITSEQAEFAFFNHDYETARVFYEQQCSDGRVDSCRKLGFVLVKDPQQPDDIVRARGLFEEACGAGWTEACFNLGLMLNNGDGGSKDLVRARQLFDRTCAEDNAEGCTRAGAMYMLGDGGPKDPENGATFFEKGCRLGDEQGCTALEKAKQSETAARS